MPSRRIFGMTNANDEKFGYYQEVSSNTKGFYKLKRLAEKTPTNLPVKAYYFARTDGVQNYEAYPGTSFRNFLGNDFNGVLAVYQANTTLMSRDRMKLILANRLLTKVNDTDVDLGVALGEYKETARFIGNAATKIAHSYVDLRKGRFEKAVRGLFGTSQRGHTLKDIPKYAANTYLGWTYGLKPLLKDISDACEALEKRYQEPPAFKYVRTRLSQPIKHRDNTSPDVNGTYRQISGDGDLIGKGEIHYQPDSVPFRLLSSLGLINPASVAWELVPFSFVVDWFIPVGNFITNVLPPPGVKFLRGWYSMKCTGRNSNLVRLEVYKKTLRLNSDVSIKERIPISSFPSPRLLIPDLSLSKSHIASGIALLTQVGVRSKGDPITNPFRRIGSDYWTD